MERSTVELIVFVVYLLCMLGIGVFFFVKSKTGGEKEYFLGGREMGPFVTALSAGTADMSAWVLMGLPASIYALGMGQIWIPVGLAIGYAISWIFEAPRLRKFSIVADDSITIPQYLTNRFKSSSKSLQVVCAIIFLVAYTVYAASSIKACGTLFNTVAGIDANVAMYVAALITIGYVFMGGFKASCWTDFFQGLLMLGAMMLACPVHDGLRGRGRGISGRVFHHSHIMARHPERPGVGPGLLRHAAYHRALHEPAFAKGNEEVRYHRHRLDRAHRHLRRVHWHRRALVLGLRPLH